MDAGQLRDVDPAALEERKDVLALLFQDIRDCVRRNSRTGRDVMGSGTGLGGWLDGTFVGMPSLAKRLLHLPEAEPTPRRVRPKRPRHDRKVGFGFLCRLRH